ncbi:uncharacterized protein BJ212DRAFT_1446308 [Suillus subaureus]|uniref:Tyr recombinase domain-containing protein n=1 Tax=Suillus subaureus TaxID=48587 RepID=A0A9P7EET6_9AGAM|nr:uncharacterized protein BJ212DRAFT_1446308 [Suillus subaureus]KAG1819262.1 hypothetical protein BJ212DRAFT_1446308 [Suillus subaureus]
MQAAMTYMFGHLQGLGNLPWHESELHSSQMLGNPSVSVKVSSYMCSLRRHKVQAGKVAISARTITPQHILKRMYHFNHHPDNWAILDYRPGGCSDGSSESLRWAGGRIRRCLHAAYTIAFLCMLHSDEVLKIQLHDLHFFSNGLILTLPFRKTHQNGEEHLCAIQAIAEWIAASKILTGYLFRKFASGDRITEANQPLTSERFLELFRNNLLDIGVDPSSYGTHSFWCGGCQYLHIERQWPLHRICEWGGWSLEFTNLMIVKYLISHNDDATEPCEHFFNPDRSPSVKCPHCGRSCPCA